MLTSQINSEAAKAHRAPSEAQKESGNYRKGHISVHGLNIAIENPKGGERNGIGKDGEPWSVKMPAHYGYFKRTEGADGDCVDCYVGPHAKSPKVYVIDQVDADTGDFDEHKCMLGFASQKQAVSTYCRGFSDGKGNDRIGGVAELDVDRFKDWLKNGATTKQIVARAGGGRVGYAFLPVDPHEMAALRTRRAVKRDNYASGGSVPTFDPSKPFEEVGSTAPSFDPSQPFEASNDGGKSWTDYIPRAIKDIPGEAYAATADAIKGAARNLLPDSVIEGGRSPGTEGTLEGLGKTGSGLASALSIPFAPVVGAARSLIGHPLESATHTIGTVINPEVAAKDDREKMYEETKHGVDMALMGMGARGFTPRGAIATTPVPATPRQLLAEAAERQDVRIPRAAATDSIPVQATSGALKEVPVVGSPLVKSSRNALRDMDAAVDRTVSGYGSGQPLSAGDAALQGIEGWIGGTSKDVANRVYQTVDNLVDPVYTRQLHATEKVVADIMAKRANARISGKSPAVDEVLDAVRDPNGLNYEGLKDLRTHIGDMTPEEMVAKGIKAGEAKRIYGALSEDLRGTVLDAGGPDALKAFDKASALYESLAEKRKALSKIIGTKADATPERVVARLTEMASSKGGANYSGLTQVRRAIGADAWDEVTSAMINRMGRDKPGSDFSGDRFVTAWNAMPENTRRLVFNSTNKPGLAKSVEDIVLLSDAHKRLMRFGNPSGTGRVATLGGMAAALATEPMTTLSTALGGNILARVFASPLAAKKAATWTNAYVNAVKSGAAPGRMALLQSASANLANTLNKQFGTALTGPDILRLQGPTPSRAEE